MDKFPCETCEHYKPESPRDCSHPRQRSWLSAYAARTYFCRDGRRHSAYVSVWRWAWLWLTYLRLNPKPNEAVTVFPWEGLPEPEYDFEKYTPLSLFSRLPLGVDSARFQAILEVEGGATFPALKNPLLADFAPYSPTNEVVTVNGDFCLHCGYHRWSNDGKVEHDCEPHEAGRWR